MTIYEIELFDSPADDPEKRLDLKTHLQVVTIYGTVIRKHNADLAQNLRIPLQFAGSTYSCGFHNSSTLLYLSFFFVDSQNGSRF